MNITFLITTYNRPYSCQRLVDSLQGQGDIVVLGDGVDYNISGCKFINLREHNGRGLYWKTVYLLFSIRGHSQYFIMLPDDFLPVPNMGTKAIEMWKGIEDPRKICLNLYMDREGMPCWTRMRPIDCGDVWRTGWVDMCFLAEDRFFQSINIETTKGNSKSSGIGGNISLTLYGKGFHFYQVKESLVIPQVEHGESQMHKPENDNSRYSINPRQGRFFDNSRNVR
jgi:hypothetical protein